MYAVVTRKCKQYNSFQICQVLEQLIQVVFVRLQAVT